MNRRSFFGVLAGAVGAPFLVKAEQELEPIASIYVNGRPISLHSVESYSYYSGDSGRLWISGDFEPGTIRWSKHPDYDIWWSA